MPLFYTVDTPTPTQMVDTLQAVKDVGIALFSLVVVALIIVAAIAYIRSDKASATQHQTITALTHVIEDYKTDRDESEVRRTEERQQSAEGLMAIADAHNRLADTQDKIADVLAELKNQQRYAGDEHTKQGAVLQGIQDGLRAVLADTPLLPHLEEIKTALLEIKAAVECQPKDIAALMTRLDAIQKVLEIDLSELRARQDAAVRIQHTINTLPDGLS